MNGRDLINQVITKHLLAFLGVAVISISAGIFFTQYFPNWWPLPFIGFIGVWLWSFGRAVCCPHCKASVMGLWSLPNAGKFLLSKKIKYCPFCGARFDDTIAR
ncbi:MAG: hypothetical protein HOO93_00970 [Methyloglobulus sp.]|nr:hypothetical protein [Methyloglobulus sp.]